MVTEREPSTSKRIAIAGAGRMGTAIARRCMRAGHAVRLFDIDDVALGRAHAAIFGSNCGDSSSDEWLRVLYTRDIAEAIDDADLLIESLPERIEIKSRFLSTADSVASPRTIFATNTSSLLPSVLARSTSRHDRFLAIHFYPPVEPGDLVDIMAHSATDPAVVSWSTELVRGLGLTPIVHRRESPGYIVNAIFGAVHREALTLLTNGVASPHDIDRAWMHVTGLASGPFGQMDEIGLDTILAIHEYWASITANRAWQRIIQPVSALVEEGMLGEKSGQGFYRYPDPAFRQPGFFDDPA